MPAYKHESDFKTCTKCNETKPITSFWKGKVVRKDGTRGYRSYCIECGTKERLDTYHNKGGKARQKERSFKYNISRYGLTEGDYNAMLEQQKNKCAICGVSEVNVKNKSYNLYVDHCHITNKVRGLLCNHCNTGLGMFKDKIELLQKAQDYLNEDSLGYRNNV